MKLISVFALTFTLLALPAVAEEERTKTEIANPKNDAHVWDSETWENGSSTTFWRTGRNTETGEETSPTVCNSSTSSLKSGK